MKKFNSIYIYLTLYLIIIFIISLVSSNIDFLILTGVCSILLIFMLLIEMNQKRLYKKIIVKHNLLIEQKQYEILIEFLNSYKKKYYVKALITNLYFYIGDEQKYLSLYNEYKNMGRPRGYYYRLLHYTNDYYNFLSHENKISLTEDCQFPLNKIIILFNNNKFNEVKELIELLPKFKSDVINYVVKFIYICSLRNMGKNTDKNLKELELLINDNHILKSHYEIHF